ncbi:MAG: signal peptide peptidase SppA [Thermoanaerobaculales bacterium]|jgi:protease-4|nr:signal peptide peptidase SppA [Thermoanaerobaculales bacterium]
MAKARTVFLGAGCLLLLVGAVIMVVLVRGLAAPSLPGEIVVSLRLAGPVVEVVPEDPLAELTGDQPTSMRRVREALVRAAADPRVRGLRLEIDSVDAGFAAAQELRTLIARVGAAGKWTAAYMDTAGEFAAGNLVYFVASACDEVSMHPQGDLNLVGLSSRTPFIRGTFDKLAIRTEFPGRGDYKTARFMYTEKDFTDAHREMTGWLLDSVMAQMVEGIAGSRELSADEVRSLIDRAPFLGADAVTVGLVDRMEDRASFEERLEEREPGAQTVSARTYLRRGHAPSSGPTIAVVTATGAIMRGESGQSFNPLFGGEVMGSETIARAFQDARELKGLEAVVFRIDSPGGSAMASEIIREEMLRTAEKVPVVVSMANVAASGGYWITCGAQKIVAEPGTITSSIGVFAGHVNTSDFWSEKLGVTYGRLDRGANANIYGDLEDWTDAQRAVVDRVLDRIYDDFLARVAESRGMSRDEVDAIGRGRVFTGAQAVEKGLVDVLGGLDEALAEAKKLADVSPETAVQLVELPRMLPWWQQLAQRRNSDRVALEGRLEELERWLATGTIETPGAVWMPPITIQ